MQIFIDGVDVAKIAAAAATGLLDGVTTNPSSLSKVTGDPVETVRAICGAVPEGVVNVEITQQDPEAAYREGLFLAKIDDAIVVKVPCDTKYLSTIGRLLAEGIPVNSTLVFSQAQVLAMAKLGVTYISLFIGRLYDAGIDGFDIADDAQAMLRDFEYDSELLIASVRTMEQYNRAIAGRYDVCTIPHELFTQMAAHELSTAGMERFVADWCTAGNKPWAL